MDWMTAEDNRPEPVPVVGGLFEPMDWSVIDLDQTLRIEPVDKVVLDRLLASPTMQGLPRCVAAGYLDDSKNARPFMLHAYGRLGGGNSMVNVNGALRSGAAVPMGGDPGLFFISIGNFGAVERFDQWRNIVLTNPTPAKIWLRVMSATRVPGTRPCRIGGERCRIYRGEIQLDWAQEGLSRKTEIDPVTKRPVKVTKPEDPVFRRAPAKPGSLSVVFEDPCWATRDGFIEAYASRSRLLEGWHRRTN